VSYLPKDPHDKDPKKVTPTRLAIWVFVGAVGVYLIITGIIGVINHG
jgi:hypothetical protein